MKKINPIFFILFIVGLICISFFKEYRYDPHKESKWLKIFESDMANYYMNLPAVFIYHDLEYEFIKNKELKDRYAWFNRGLGTYPYITKSGKKFNKYYVGTSVMQLPFFLVAWAITCFTDHPSDGYSLPFQIMIFVAALFYFLTGLFYLYQLLQSFNLSVKSSLVTVTGIALATNAFNYVSYDPGTSHIYIFFTVSMFLFHFREFVLNNKSRSLIVASIFLGLTTIIRPTTILILLAIPFLAGDHKTLTEKFRNTIGNPILVAASVISFIAIIFIQLGLYKYQTGHWLVWSYENEGFNFLSPQFYEILFGFRKGLFIYSPFIFLTIVGGVILFPKNRYLSLAILLPFSIISYVISSWWNWWYGGAFGMRAMVDYYPFFAISIGFLINKVMKSKVSLVIPIVLAMTISLNLFQNWQYSNQILHYDKMDFDKYRQIFLENDSIFRFSTNPRNNYFTEFDVKQSQYFSCHFDKNCGDKWSVPIAALKFYNQNYKNKYCVVDLSYQDGAIARINSQSLLPGGKNIIITCRAKIRTNEAKTRSKFIFNVKNSEYWYGGKIIQQVRKTGQWTWVEFQYKISRLKNDTNEITSYITNQSKLTVDVDSMEIGFHYIDFWDVPE